MALLRLSDFDRYEEFLQQQLSESPAISVTELRGKLIETHAVSCLERTMQTWLERARADAPTRTSKRGSTDVSTLEDTEEHGEYLRGLLAEDPSIGWRTLREAIKAKGFLVSERTMRNWLDRYHGKCSRALLAAPIEGLHVLDMKGLRLYEGELLKEAVTDPDKTYTQMKAFLEERFGRTCSKNIMKQWMQSPFTGLSVVPRSPPR